MNDWENAEEIDTCENCGKLFMSYNVEKCPHCGYVVDKG
jgi:ribosomal protein L37E